MYRNIALLEEKKTEQNTFEFKLLKEDFLAKQQKTISITLTD